MNTEASTTRRQRRQGKYVEHPAFARFSTDELETHALNARQSNQWPAADAIQNVIDRRVQGDA